VAIRRKAVADYTFSTASPTLTVHAGATLCVSSYALTRDASIYPDPETFDGARFINGRSNDPNARYADVSEYNLNWGYGSLAWCVCRPFSFTFLPATSITPFYSNSWIHSPGRQHTSYFLKVVVAYVLRHYELALVEPGARQWWSWEGFSMPYASTRVLFTPRTGVLDTV
jgi:cytochrome P450